MHGLGKGESLTLPASHYFCPSCDSQTDLARTAFVLLQSCMLETGSLDRTPSVYLKRVGFGAGLVFCTCCRCAHNQVYWAASQPYHAFGLGAASLLGARRFARPRAMGAYRAWVERFAAAGGGVPGILPLVCHTWLLQYAVHRAELKVDWSQYRLPPRSAACRCAHMQGERGILPWLIALMLIALMPSNANKNICIHSQRHARAQATTRR